MSYLTAELLMSSSGADILPNSDRLQYSEYSFLSLYTVNDLSEIVEVDSTSSPIFSLQLGSLTGS